MSKQIPLPQPLFPDRPTLRPTKRTWLKHSLLLLITFFTATLAGAIFPFGRLDIFPELLAADAPDSWAVLLNLPQYYLNLVVRALTSPAELFRALSFSVPLMIILTAHEAGHYVACRIYRVHSTLPYFIPTPPLIGPAGTFGAFIKILAPMPSRKAVFDIGVAGPIAGFVALIPVAVIAFLTMDQVSPEFAAAYRGEIYFADPLFMQAMAALFSMDLGLTIPNGFYFATWMGLLVTALNLIPSGQLDGGHANFAVFGPRVHRWTGIVAFAVMALLAFGGYWLYGSPSGFLIAVLLGVMLRVGHPSPLDSSPLDAKRKAVALLTLIIFVICFVPFPIRLVE
ncbi:MAG: site-2 protease family protein [Acidobacteria bacterium]|nr:MAG: site-2 protease family protein [Acidobacteriota bacterium]REJ99175.1 MAG: site-2 protease family protein [Acidobacteriota bacterium]REK16104.1 MAG: site-2 protease family protein [Acidobacteriota bacterium]REK43785.1 MAG: site-2 protease family protein [Acidobacteriota bacterium]